MGLTGWIVGSFDDGNGRIYECRECGTGLASPEERCPYCGPTAVVRFELPEWAGPHPSPRVSGSGR